MMPGSSGRQWLSLRWAFPSYKEVLVSESRVSGALSAFFAAFAFLELVMAARCLVCV